MEMENPGRDVRYGKRDIPAYGSDTTRDIPGYGTDKGRDIPGYDRDTGRDIPDYGRDIPEIVHSGLYRTTSDRTAYQYSSSSGVGRGGGGGGGGGGRRLFEKEGAGLGRTRSERMPRRKKKAEEFVIEQNAECQVRHFYLFCFQKMSESQTGAGNLKF